MMLPSPAQQLAWARQQVARAERAEAALRRTPARETAIEAAVRQVQLSRAVVATLTPLAKPKAPSPKPWLRQRRGAQGELQL